MQVLLRSESETAAFGAALQRHVPEKCLIYLHGQLGAGKTTLVRSFLRAAGYAGTVKSPTYTLVEEYAVAGRKVIHFDLYRVADPEELDLIGIRDYFAQQAICFIEWPEMGRGFLPPADLSIALTVVLEGRLAKIDNAPDAMKKEFSAAQKKQ